MITVTMTYEGESQTFEFLDMDTAMKFASEMIERGYELGTIEFSPERN